jgi:hypothetical protein
MNVERDTKVAFTVSYSELVRALKLLYPEEFMLNQLPTVWSTGVQVEIVQTSGVRISSSKRSSGPAEIEINRAQRSHAGDQ